MKEQWQKKKDKLQNVSDEERAPKKAKMKELKAKGDKGSSDDDSSDDDQ